MVVVALFSAATQSPGTVGPPLVDQPRKSWRELAPCGTDGGALTFTCAPTGRNTLQGVVQAAPSTVTGKPATVLFTVRRDWPVYRASKVTPINCDPAGTVRLRLAEVLPSSHLENRSEERRVGKECRSRWSPHHQKKRKLRITRRHPIIPLERLHLMFAFLHRTR